MSDTKLLFSWLAVIGIVIAFGGYEGWIALCAVVLLTFFVLTLISGGN